jgi:hypothetical protein
VDTKVGLFAAQYVHGEFCVWKKLYDGDISHEAGVIETMQALLALRKLLEEQAELEQTMIERQHREQVPPTPTKVRPAAAAAAAEPPRPR